MTTMKNTSMAKGLPAAIALLWILFGVLVMFLSFREIARLGIGESTLIGSASLILAALFAIGVGIATLLHWRWSKWGAIVLSVLVLVYCSLFLLLAAGEFGSVATLVGLSLLLFALISLIVNVRTPAGGSS
jgi:hypothetical protein